MKGAFGRSIRRSLLRGAASFAPEALLVRRGSTRTSRVALTFDDGPDELTRVYLDALDRLGVRATFFLVGDACARRPADVLEIVARGHEVASHGQTHRKFPSLSASELSDELARVQELLPRTVRRRPLVRPPGGIVSLKSLFRCAAAGYTTVLWSLDSQDCRTQSVDAVVSHAARARAGEIVLLHEGQQWTIDALPEIVRSLRMASLDLVTVSDLLAAG